MIPDGGLQYACALQLVWNDQWITGEYLINTFIDLNETDVPSCFFIRYGLYPLREVLS